MVADIELVADAEDPEIKRLQLVILESLAFAVTLPQMLKAARLLVGEDGQVIPPGEQWRVRKFSAKKRALFED